MKKNDVFHNILSRRTVHSYQRGIVDSEVLNKAIEAAVHALNHYASFPWKFIRLSQKKRAKICDLAIDIVSQGKTVSESRKEIVKNKILHPPELLVLVQKKSGDAFRQKEDYAAMACAVQNMSLYLWSEGYGSKWSTGEVTRAPETHRALGLTESEESVGFFYIGKADIKIKKPVKPTLGSVFFDL